MRVPDRDTFYIVDVFSSRPYQGNPLAVVWGQRSPELMQAITREMNYSETTFLEAGAPGEPYPVRIFTPGRELPFAGHPTLGTAFVLRHFLGVPDDSLVLQEAVGPIPVHVEQRDGRDCYWMTQNAPTFGTTYDVKGMAELLSLPADAIDGQYPIQAVSTGLPALIVPLVSVEAASQSRLDLEKYRALLRAGAPSSVLVFAKGGVQAGHDIHVRVFVGDLGIPEDPATGSANGCLAAYLLKYGVTGGTVDAVVEQGVEMGRPSTLYLRARHRGGRVEVGGEVVPVAEGRLLPRP